MRCNLNLNYQSKQKKNQKKYRHYDEDKNIIKNHLQHFIQDKKAISIHLSKNSQYPIKFNSLVQKSLCSKMLNTNQIAIKQNNKKMVKKKVDIYIYDLAEELGKGAFGTVYKGSVYKGNQKVAVKVLNKKAIDKDKYQKEAMQLQIKILRKINSANIVGFKDVIQTPNNYYIIQELCDGGDLQGLLDKRKIIPEIEAIQYMGQIITGFFDIIRHGIVHRDLKPQNILISNGKLKIADFGLARSTGEDSMLQSQVGTPLYESPQILDGEKYSYKCDIWALGLIFYQMLYGCLPWKPKQGKKGYARQIRQKKLQFPNQPQISNDTKNFIKNCLKVQEQTRYQWQDVFQNIIFQQGKLPKFEVLTQKLNYAMQQIRRNIHQNNVDMYLFFNRYANNSNQITRKDFGKMILKLAPNLRKKQVDYVLSKFDKNANGTVNFDQFKNTLEAHDVRFKKFSYSQLKKIFSGVMDDQISKLQEQRIQKMSIITRKLQEGIAKQSAVEIYPLFQKFDKVQNSGSLSKQTFFDLVASIQPDMSEDECIFLFKEFDDNSDGKISFQQFYKHMKMLLGMIQ